LRKGKAYVCCALKFKESPDNDRTRIKDKSFFMGWFLDANGKL
jgi:hypothetical protein